MDSDDVWTPNALKSLLVAAGSDSSAIGAHGVGDFIDESGEPVDPGVFANQGLKRIGLLGSRLGVIPTTAPTDFAVLLANGSVFPPGLLLVEREAYVRAGPFDENLSAGEDWEMLARVVRQGHLAFLPEVMLFYRRHDGNRSTMPDAPELVYRAYCQIFHSPLNSTGQLALARRVWRATQRERVSNCLAEVRSLRLRSPKASASDLARSAVATGRLLRGYPKPVVRSSRLDW
jgi:hypothetical protein